MSDRGFRLGRKESQLQHGQSALARDLLFSSPLGSLRDNLTMSDFDQLITIAKQSRENAHAPYSNFRVGAALRASSGRIFGGCNVENATYGLTVCAERVAILKAISEGERGFDAISVVTDTDTLTPPCGACRQLIWEFCGDVPVMLANLKGKTEQIQMRGLFPRPFDSSNL
jgi:cytidine deaminase